MANLIRKEVTFESSIAAIGAAMSDISRVKILSALMDGRAWTATELSSVANISASTASSHLSKLLDCQLITVVAQGKHRYFRLAGKDIAELMESMMGISLNHGVHAKVSTPVHLRKARTCYDHLAGEVAVKIYDSLCQQQWITENGSMITLSGIQYFHEMGIDVPSKHSRKICCALMNPLMILVKIIKLRWIHILSYDQMVSRKINNQTTRCANSIFYTTLFTNSAPNYT
ncbi:winged helix-turn-helix domain-containing protein [Escherichia coli]|uniref:ArsR/SmtB family transcription factor n=2 Tax=Escherichia coli TaxID=562 RepID=UPI0031595DB0